MEIDDRTCFLSVKLENVETSLDHNLPSVSCIEMLSVQLLLFVTVKYCVPLCPLCIIIHLGFLHLFFLKLLRFAFGPQILHSMSCADRLGKLIYTFFFQVNALIVIQKFTHHLRIFTILDFCRRNLLQIGELTVTNERHIST